MKALLITAIASFFALSVSAQVSTDTKVGSTTVTGTKQMGAARPAKVATSTTSTLTSVNDNNNKVSSTRKDANTPAATENSRPTKTKAIPVGAQPVKEENSPTPGVQRIAVTRSSDAPAVKDEAPR
jgi:hypothetical protein